MSIQPSNSSIFSPLEPMPCWVMGCDQVYSAGYEYLLWLLLIQAFCVLYKKLIMPLCTSCLEAVFIVHRVHSRVRPLMSLCPSSLHDTSRHCRNQQAGRKLPVQFQLGFSRSCSPNVWCLQQLSFINQCYKQPRGNAKVYIVLRTSGDSLIHNQGWDTEFLFNNHGFQKQPYPVLQGTSFRSI